jgi:hypothetical protein
MRNTAASCFEKERVQMIGVEHHDQVRPFRSVGDRPASIGVSPRSPLRLSACPLAFGVQHRNRRLLPGLRETDLCGFFRWRRGIADGKTTLPDVGAVPDQDLKRSNDP